MSDSNNLSRRDFLKILGSGAIALGLGVVGFGGGLVNLAPRNNSKQTLESNGNGNGNLGRQAAAISAGSWSTGITTVVVAIHAGLLPSGKVFFIAGSGFHTGSESGPFKSAIWDPSTNTQNTFSQQEDLFCVGNCMLPNGNGLCAGGTLAYDNKTSDGHFHGLKSIYEVNASTGVPSKVATMAHGRWYPTCVTLPDGKVLIVHGFNESGDDNLQVEVYNYPSKSLTIKGNSPDIGLYPRMHLLPSGLVATAGMKKALYTYDPALNKWNSAGTWQYSGSQRHYGSSFLLPLSNTTLEKGKILLVGGSPTSSTAATSHCEILEPNGTKLVSRVVDSLDTGRKFASPVILPDGKLLIIGGTKQNQSDATKSVKTPEVFDPATEKWSNLPDEAFFRTYHTVALLLPNGKVWVAGSTPSRTKAEMRSEIFSPGYTFETRPVISGAPTSAGYNASITLQTNNGSSIKKVSLVRLSSMTHHYNTDMRLIWLPIKSQTGTSVTVLSPINSKLAPPGYYMIHILNSANIPSVSKIINIGGTSNTSISSSPGGFRDQ